MYTNNTIFKSKSGWRIRILCLSGGYYIENSKGRYRGTLYSDGGEFCPTYMRTKGNKVKKCTLPKDIADKIDEMQTMVRINAM